MDMCIDIVVKEVVPPKEVAAIVSILLGISIEVKITLFVNASALISITLGACVFQSSKVIVVLVSQPIFLITCLVKIVAWLGGLLQITLSHWVFVKP